MICGYRLPFLLLYDSKLIYVQAAGVVGLTSGKAYSSDLLYFVPVDMPKQFGGFRNVSLV